MAWMDGWMDGWEQAAARASLEFPPPAASSVVSMELFPPCLQREALLVAVATSTCPTAKGIVFITSPFSLFSVVVHLLCSFT